MEFLIAGTGKCAGQGNVQKQSHSLRMIDIFEAPILRRPGRKVSFSAGKALKLFRFGWKT
jgi:hypothetical protein